MVIHIEKMDLPAEWVNGSKRWFLHGIQHGEDNDFTNESWKHFQKTLLF